jgi:cysteine peptidase B
MRVVAMTALVAMLAAIGVTGANNGADYVEQFELFKKTHGRQYVSQSEEAKRLGYFVRNMQNAARLQVLNPLARFGMNEFSDLSEDEFKVRHNAEAHFRRAIRNRQKRPAPKLKAAGKFAQQQDWRQHGAVTQVKNQGQCGSCWSFSTTGNIEGQWALAGNTLVSLSEQELVSCDTTCYGCNGGLMDDAFEWLVSARGGGITSESQYPYQSGSGVAPSCDLSGMTDVAWITGHTDIAHDENSMAQQVSTGGPLSIGVDATSWQTYQGGILTDCTSSQVDHGVLIVGYDLTNSPPYWIIKNSWGESWGENGYLRVEYGQNQCLITSAPSTSIASGSHPPTPPTPPTPPGPTPPSPPSPTPPSPSTGSFTQAVCPNMFCLSGCQQQTFATGSCLSLSGGGSAIATCGQNNLYMQVFSSSDCSGTSQTDAMPLYQCLQDTQGTYVYNVCNNNAKAHIKNSGNATVIRRH